MIPKNAERIIAARLKGQRPADMVLVAMCEPTPIAADLVNPAVVALAGIAYDWRWVRGLDVALYVNNEDDWGALVKAIALQHPDYLCVWNYEENWGARVWLMPTAEDVEKPKRYWKFDIHFTLWYDFQNKDFVNRYNYDEYADGIPSPFKKNRRQNAAN